MLKVRDVGRKEHMMRVISTRQEVSSAQELFQKSLAKLSADKLKVSIGFQGGNISASVYWLSSFNIWAYFGEPPLEKSPGERYWNVFGAGKPYGQVNIDCEINPPVEGINRRAAGAFVHGASNEIYLVHRGLLNANGRMRKDFVLNNFQDKLIKVIDGNKEVKVIKIGNLKSSDFPYQLKEFITRVQKVKEKWRSR